MQDAKEAVLNVEEKTRLCSEDNEEIGIKPPPAVAKKFGWVEGVLVCSLKINKKYMLSLAPVSASEVVIWDVADKFKLPCQRVHTVTVTVCRRPDSNRRWLTPALKATDLDHSATTLRNRLYIIRINDHHNLYDLCNQ